MRLTFIDLETTSTDSNLTNIIQLWIKRVINGITEKEINSYFSNNGQYITLSSRNITGITEKMLVGKPLFEESVERQFLCDNNWDTIYIAHNWKSFDFKVLSRYGIHFKYTIDTLLVAQIILDSYYEELEQSYKLGHLRYWMEDKGLITLPSTLNAHNAYDDIIILEQVFSGLILIYKQKYPTKTEQEILFDFIKMTNEPQLLTKMTFGKYKGVKFEDIPKSYLTWCLDNMTELNDNLKYTLQYYTQLESSTVSQNQITEVKNQKWHPPTLTISIPSMPIIQLENSTQVWVKQTEVEDPSIFNFGK